MKLMIHPQLMYLLSNDKSGEKYKIRIQVKYEPEHKTGTANVLKKRLELLSFETIGSFEIIDATFRGDMFVDLSDSETEVPIKTSYVPTEGEIPSFNITERPHDSKQYIPVDETHISKEVMNENEMMIEFYTLRGTIIKNKIMNDNEIDEMCSHLSGIDKRVSELRNILITELVAIEFFGNYHLFSELSLQHLKNATLCLIIDDLRNSFIAGIEDEDKENEKLPQDTLQDVYTRCIGLQ